MRSTSPPGGSEIIDEAAWFESSSSFSTAALGKTSSPNLDVVARLTTSRFNCRRKSDISRMVFSCNLFVEQNVTASELLQASYAKSACAAERASLAGW